jgi:hypothetical protein
VNEVTKARLEHLVHGVMAEMDFEARYDPVVFAHLREQAEEDAIHFRWDKAESSTADRIKRIQIARKKAS